MHLLLLARPRPFAFFASITALADVIAAAAPFTQPAPLACKVFTAIINIVVGVAVISLLSGVGRSAARPVGRAEPGRTDDYSPGRQHLAAPCDVLVMAASIWIAIFLEPHLGLLPTRATLAQVSQPASCRFRHGAARPAVRRPVRCTQQVRAEVVNLRE